MMRKSVIIAGICALYITANAHQMGKSTERTVDSTVHSKRIKKAPLDTSADEKGKFKNSPSGGEHTGKNIDRNRQGKPRK
jgi:hypothetical protein